MTDEIALSMGKGIGKKLIAHYGLPVTSVVGGDVRPSTKALKQAVMEGLVAAGCQVMDMGTVPTPAFYFANCKAVSKHYLLTLATTSQRKPQVITCHVNDDVRCSIHLLGKGEERAKPFEVLHLNTSDEPLIWISPI